MMRRLLIVVVGVLVGLAGLYLGSLSRGLFQKPQETFRPPGSHLVVGQRFPEVPLLGEDERLHGAEALLGDSGTVVIFMALGCAPCKTMSHRWQEYATAGRLGKARLVGITSSSLALIRLYKENNAITFPIYADTAGVYQREWGVDEFPLRLEIDRARVIRAETYDPDEDADLPGLPARLGG